MKVDININVNLDELKELLTNCTELWELLATNVEELQNRAQDLNENDGDEKSSPKEPEPNPEQITLEEVRAKLAALMQNGKQAQVKELLKKHGGKKLSDVPKESYPALLKDAEAV